MLDRSLWTGTRRDGWRVDLLTNRDVYRRELQGVVGAASSLDGNMFRDVATGGQLTIVQPHGRDYLDDVDWLSARVAVFYLVETQGMLFEVPWGVYLAAAEVGTEHGPDATTVTVPLLDKTTVLLQDGVRDQYAIPTNTPITTTVETLIRDAGELRYAITPSAERSRTAMAWPAGTPRLTIINDLLAAIGYAALYADEQGVYRAEPYIDPDQRTPLWDFAGGPDTITAPPITESLNASDIPNRFVVTSQETESVTALVGVAENTDPESPYSYPRRGRWITQREDGTDVTSQAVANELATRRLRDSSRPAVRLPLRHLPIPLRLGNGATAPDGHHMSVVEWKVILTPMALMDTTLRRFEVV